MKYWLIVGLAMVFLQIVIGGITRLTGSGLSITEWEIVTGTFPPLSEASWMDEFNKYKETPQFSKVNRDMVLGSIFTTGTFKFIYFWEYLHRLWARTMGFVFLFPFLGLTLKGLIPKELRNNLIRVVLLAALAATFGWIMVASGLVNRPWVNAYKLALHLCIGISVFVALLWAFICYIHPERYKIAFHIPLINILFVLICIQIFFGGVMSGTKAALFISTWPDMNGEYNPAIVTDMSNWNSNNFNNYESSGFLVSLIQLVHRTIAYSIFFIGLFVGYKLFINKDANRRQKNWYIVFMILLVIQVILGIATLFGSVGGEIPVDLGVYHQGIGVLVLSAYLLFWFYSRNNVNNNKQVEI